jgi:hypothetical protein
MSHLFAWLGRFRLGLFSGGFVLLLAVAIFFSGYAASTADALTTQPKVLAEMSAITPLLSYQGRLLDPATGAPKPNGTYTFVFRVYNVASGGSELWTETKDLNVSNGLFVTFLGDAAPLPITIFTGQNLWLGIKVGADAEATPRQRLAPVAYAMYADNAGRLDGKASTEFAAASHTHSGADIANGSLPLTKLSTAGATAGQVAAYNGSTTSWSSLPANGLLRATVLNVNCPSPINIDSTYRKIADIGSFTKLDANSTIEVTFHGRIAVTGSISGGTGASFELRVNNAATTNGRARAVLKSAEVGSGGVSASMTGIFSGLAVGTHTVSMWTKTSSGTGTSAMYDPGCWSSDHIVVKELK